MRHFWRILLIAICLPSAAQAFDWHYLQADYRELKQAIRSQTAQLAPAATMAQSSRYGLFLPEHFNPALPVVVLIHGLDMESSEWGSMATLLAADHRQVGYFNYPADQPIADDVALLTQQLATLHTGQPNLKLDLIGYSMGALVSRGAVEGGNYPGGVDRLILLAPPNHGSQWARLEPILKLNHQYHLYMEDAAWRPSWFITEGLGEAAHDLLPDSDFLQRVNSLPRRAGVRYTVIDGDQHLFRRWTAKCVEKTQAVVPCGWEDVAGFREYQRGVLALAESIAAPVDDSDGPVELESASLPGVADVVTIHADHLALYRSVDGEAPAAWGAIRDRLSR